MSVSGESHQRAVGVWVWAVRAVSAVALLLLLSRLLPLAPRMPGKGLDPSWQWALNEAVSRGMTFGNDVAFTAGPASALVTNTYHPAVQWVTVALAIVVAVIAWLSLRIASGPNRQLGAAIAAIVVAGVYEREGLLLVVPLLALAALVRQARQGSNGGRWMALLMVAVVSAVCVGVKGSLIPAAGMAVVAGALFLAASRHWLKALVLPLAFVGSFALVWVAYGQPLDAVPSYAQETVELAAGYSDAMSLGRPSLEVVLIFSAVMAPWIILLTRLEWSNRAGSWIFGATACTVALTAFKVGTVRADQHIFITGSAVVAMAALALLLSNRRQRRIAAWGLGSAAVLVAAVFGPSALVALLPAQQVQGLRDVASAGRRVVGTGPDLNEAYVAAVRRVAEETSLPMVPGAVDTYSYDQAELLASGLEWSPRPVFQSYAAYSPALAESNREHLVGPAAPKWVIFAPQAIDDRYPSIEDGPSWVELIHRYQPSTMVGDKVLLHRRSDQPAVTPMHLSASIAATLGERVALRPGTGLSFAALDIEPTALGRTALTLYKSEPLRLTVWTADGAERSYRLPVGMARAGFLLSPVTSTASQFGSLYGDPSGYQTSDRTVVAIQVDSTELLWNRTYRVTVSAVDVPPT